MCPVRFPWPSGRGRIETRIGRRLVPGRRVSPGHRAGGGLKPTGCPAASWRSVSPGHRAGGGLKLKLEGPLLTTAEFPLAIGPGAD